VRNLTWPAGRPSATIPRSMGRDLDSASTAARAALSGFAFTYAYPFAWRFS